MNTTKDEVRYVGTNWEPEIYVKSKGPGRVAGRKVITKGIKRIDGTGLLWEITKAMRQGFEVRLTYGSGDAVRFFHLVSKDGSSMIPLVRGMDDWQKNALNGLRAEKGTIRGKTYDNAEEVSIALEKDNEKRHKEAARMICVTPDKTITCECGRILRIGKYLASSK